MLAIESLCKSLGPRRVLRDLDLAFSGSGTVWIRGANGTGKSTLLRCVAGVWRPDRGDVKVCGRSTVRDGRARKDIGYVPDHFDPFPDLSVGEMLSLVASLKEGVAPTPQTLQRMGVNPFLHQSVGRLSTGQARRAALTAALIGDPWLLVLDEPSTGLDVDGIRLLEQVLGERAKAGQAALLVTHDVSLGERVSTRAFDLVDGRLL